MTLQQPAVRHLRKLRKALQKPTKQPMTLSTGPSHRLCTDYGFCQVMTTVPLMIPSLPARTKSTVGWTSRFSNQSLKAGGNKRSVSAPRKNGSNRGQTKIW
mmetsp:Transcript_36037/g.84298  ORF Transcript_36037/g.84298 Transcript_36037/m.84298 type:complete len:101 (+) Transcript_36037:198-500(+)